MEEEDRLKLKNNSMVVRLENKKFEKESSILCYNYYICKIEELQQQHTK
jgi:hypothetical protein